MILYFVCIIISFLCSVNVRYNTIKNSIVLILFSLFIYCFGLMTGSDWPNYETSYYTRYAYTDFGYNLYSSFFYYCNVDFWAFRSLSKIICMIGVFAVLDKLSDYSFFVKTLFFSTFALIIFVSDPFRAMFAITFVLVAIYYRINDRKKLAILMCALAGLFHFSAFAIMPLVFLKPIKIPTKKLILILLIILVIFSSFDLLFYVLISVASIVPYLDSKVVAYMSFINYAEGSVAEIKSLFFTFGSLMRILSLFLLLKYRHEIVKVRYGSYIFLFGIIYVLLYRMGLTFSVLARLGYYFMIFYFLSFSIIADKIYRGYKRLLFVSFISFCFCLNAYTILTTSYEYLPYSNLWEYILKGDIPSYNYRKSYNPINSPYMNEYQENNEY